MRILKICPGGVCGQSPVMWVDSGNICALYFWVEASMVFSPLSARNPRPRVDLPRRGPLPHRHPGAEPAGRRRGPRGQAGVALFAQRESGWVCVHLGRGQRGQAVEEEPVQKKIIVEFGFIIVDASSHFTSQACHPGEPLRRRGHEPQLRLPLGRAGARRVHQRQLLPHVPRAGGVQRDGAAGREGPRPRTGRRRRLLPQPPLVRPAHHVPVWIHR